MIRAVSLSKYVQKSLSKLPKYIVLKLMAWVDDVEHNGLEEARKRKAYHDEPLQGSRKGQRSIRLSLAYRAIYELKNNDLIEFVSIEEVHKHDY